MTVPAVALIALYLFVVLAANSGIGTRAIIGLVNNALPGSINVDYLQVQPSLNRVAVRHATLYSPEGQEVIHVDNLRCEIDLTGLLFNRVEFETCRGRRGRVLVQNEHRGGRLGIAATFSPEDRNKGTRDARTVLLFNNTQLEDVDVLINLADLAFLFRDADVEDAFVTLDQRGFSMRAGTFDVDGGRLAFSERLLGLGPGPSDAATLRWEAARFADPWKTMSSPWPRSPTRRTGLLDLPLHRFDVTSIEWIREALSFETARVEAADIEIDAEGWLQFIPEQPPVAPRESGVISFDGRAEMRLTADSPLIDFILPNAVGTWPGFEPGQTIAPLKFDAWGSVRFIEGGTQLALRDVNVFGWHVESLDGRLSLHEGVLQLHDGAEVSIWDGTVTGGARFVPRDGRWEARLCLDNVAIEDVAAPLRPIIVVGTPDWLQARVSTSPRRCSGFGDSRAGAYLFGDLTSKAGFDRDPARFTPEGRELQADMIALEAGNMSVTWQRGVAGTPISRANVSVAARLDQRGVIHVEDGPGRTGLIVRTQEDRLLFNGAIDTISGNLDGARARLETSNLGAWMTAAGIENAPEEVATTIDLRLEGPALRPRARSADITLSNPRADIWLPEMEVSTSLSASPGGHSIGDFSFRSPIGEVDLSGDIALFGDSLTEVRSDPSVDLRIDAGAVDLGLLSLPFAADARLSSASVQLSGSVSDPQARGSFILDDIRFREETFDILQADFEADTSNIRLTDLHLVKDKGMARGSLAWNLAEGSIDTRLTGQRFSLRSFETLRRTGQRVEGEVSFDIAASGTVDNPRIAGSTVIEDIVIDRRELGPLVLTWASDEEEVHVHGTAGGDLNLRVEAPHGREPMAVSAWFQNFPLDAYIGELGQSFAGSRTSGRLEANVDPWSGGTGEANLLIDSLRMPMDDGAIELREPASVSWRGSAQRGGVYHELGIDNLIIGSGDRFVTFNGVGDSEGELEASLIGELDLALLQLFPDLIADAEGSATVELRANGDIEDPQLRGFLRVGESRIAPRGLGAAVEIRSAMLEVRGSEVRIPQSDPLQGRLFNGDLTVSGLVGLRAFVPNSFDLNTQVTGLAYRIPNELNVTLNGDLRLSANPIRETESWAVSGDIELVDARYYRDFNVLSDAFNIGGIGRTVASFSQPIWVVNPVIRDMRADLRVTGRDRFRVMSTIANAQLNLELKTDLRVTGRLGQMEVFGEMAFLENSRVYYGDRRFTVSDGALIFDGYIDDQGFPWPFIDMRIDTEFKSTCASRRRGSLDAQQTESQLVRRATDTNPTIFMEVEVQGRLPLDLNFAFDSRPFYDQRDQLSLIVTGCSVDELTSGSGSAPTLELVFRPVISIVEQSVEERFNIDDVDLIPTPDGNADIIVEDEVSERLTWRLDATVGPEDATRQTITGQFTLRDGLQLELLQESDSTTPFSLNSGLRFRWRLQ